MDTNIKSPQQFVHSAYLGKLSVPWLRIGIHAVGIFPVLEIAIRYFFNRLTINPIQYLEQFFGLAAINMLILALAVTPIHIVTGWKQIVKHRRALGLYSFLYFALHFIVFVAVDYQFDLHEIIRQTLEKPFILVGLVAGILLLALAGTSFRYWMKHLGRKWSILHRAVYAIGLLAVLHFAMAVKGSLGTLSGDIARPLLSGLVVILLLLVRIPWIRRKIISIRQGVQDRL